VCHFKAKAPAKRGFLKKNLKQPGNSPEQELNYLGKKERSIKKGRELWPKKKNAV